MIEIENTVSIDAPKILVMGIGGAGNNALDRMIDSCTSDAKYIAVNTDIQVLNASKAEIKIQIGKKITKGYGAGATPELGENAAIESEDEIKSAIEGADMCIITCGMGGGTGTGAAPIIAKYCKDAGILTVGIVTTPFSFENTPRTSAAKAGVDKLKEQVDTLLVIPNDKLIGLSEKPLLLETAFEMADTVLKDAIEGITNIVNNLGMVNLDFNDLCTTLRNKGIGHLSIGKVDAESSVLEAVKQAINSPLLETTIEGAENILINTSGKLDIVALNEAISYVRELAGNNVNVIWGTVANSEQDAGKIVVTFIATGMSKKANQLKNTTKESVLKENLKLRTSNELDLPTFLQGYTKPRNNYTKRQ